MRNDNLSVLLEIEPHMLAIYEPEKVYLIYSRLLIVFSNDSKHDK